MNLQITILLFTELQAGALDALAIDIGVANYQIKSRGEGYKILEETLNTEQYAIAFKRVIRNYEMLSMQI